jgi:hypothetical protein
VVNPVLDKPVSKLPQVRFALVRYGLQSCCSIGHILIFAGSRHAVSLFPFFVALLVVLVVLASAPFIASAPVIAEVQVALVASVLEIVELVLTSTIIAETSASRAVVCSYVLLAVSDLE